MKKLALILLMLMQTACFGTVCNHQRVMYTDKDGQIYWNVTSCHPRVVLKWK